MNVNDLYEDKNNNNIYRVIDKDILLNRIAVIDINSTKNYPHWMKLDEFQSWVDNKVIQLIPEKFPRFIDNSVLNEVEKNQRDKLMECVRFGIEHFRSELLERESRHSVYESIAEKFNFSMRKVERVFGRYWKRGMTKAALVPDYRRDRYDEDKDKEEEKVRLKNGRKRKFSNSKGIVITGTIKEQMEEIIKDFYLTPKKPFFSAAYDELLGKYYKEFFYLDDFGEPQYNEDCVPSLSQFYYYYKKEYLPDKKDNDRQGSAVAEQKNRPLLSNSYKDVTGPGQVYQLDATIIDVEIVHSGTRQPIGKPAVIALADVYTHLIVGKYVTLAKECYESLGLAILNVVTDKVEFCSRMGIQIDARKWPNSGLPARILTDNGPARNQLFDYFIEKYNVEIEHTPPYRGDLKGIIESYWKTLGLEARTKLNGGGEWPLTRMSRDPAQYADLDINELTKIITLLTIKHNTSKIEGLRQEKDMLDAQVKPIPCEMWAFGYKNQKGYINNVGDIEQLKLALMREGAADAIITKLGIQVDTRYYVCKPFLEEKWYLTKLGEKVKFRYDKRCINYIYIPTRTGSIPCILAENSQQFLDLSEFEYYQIKENIAIEDYYLTKSKIANSVNINEMIKEVMAEGAEKTKIAREEKCYSSLSKKEARNDELNRQNTADYLTSGLSPELNMLYREYRSDVYLRDSSFTEDEDADDFVVDSMKKLNKKEEVI